MRFQIGVPNILGADGLMRDSWEGAEKKAEKRAEKRAKQS